MNSSLLALTALVGVSPAFLWGEPTVIHGKGTVYCDLPGRWWCFQVNLHEHDAPFRDDRVDFFGPRCTKKPSYEYFLNGTQYGDGGFWNTFYEFKFSIIHNCTSNGWRMRSIERHTQYAPTSSWDVEIYQWNQTILNLGLPGKEFL